jgi:hypothetical protein
MTKVSYANLKLKVNSDINTFDFDGQKIEVLKYLPIDDKYSLINITLQKAQEDGIYNPMKIDMYFNLHLIYMYSNLSFTDKQKENENKIYDTLKTNGFIDAFLQAMEEDEYNELFNYMEAVIAERTRYNTTTAAIISNVINNLPTNAQAAADIVNSFDPEKYQAVIDFATAANGNRPLDNSNVVPIK